MSDETGDADGPAKRRRSLAQQASDETRVQGEPEVAELLRRAFTVSPEDDGRVLTHGFHAWPARMHPTTARALVGATPEDSIVLDPFMGSGTVAVEALVQGRRAVGRDLNPVALEVAWTRTRVWTDKQREELLAMARDAVNRAKSLREEVPRVPQQVWDTEGAWYDPPALHEVWSLAVVLRDEGRASPVRRALRACLSSIIVKASKQASDSVPVEDRAHRFVPPKRVEGWFLRRVEELARGLSEVTASAANPREVDLGLLDAREVPRGLERSVHTVITSPPYPGVYDYVAHHQRRYGALDASPEEAKRLEIGARRAVKSKGWRDAARAFERDMTRVFRAWSQVLAPEGRAYVVIGDGQYPSGVIRVQPILQAACASSGLRVLATASQKRATWSVGGGKKSGRGRREYLLALERPR